MKIKKITRQKVKKQKVYDLEVVKYHNFLIGYGTVVHNCRYAVEPNIVGNGWGLSRTKLI